MQDSGTICQFLFVFAVDFVQFFLQHLIFTLQKLDLVQRGLGIRRVLDGMKVVVDDLGFDEQLVIDELQILDLFRHLVDKLRHLKTYLSLIFRITEVRECGRHQLLLLGSVLQVPQFFL